MIRHFARLLPDHWQAPIMDILEPTSSSASILPFWRTPGFETARIAPSTSATTLEAQHKAKGALMPHDTSPAKPPSAPAPPPVIASKKTELACIVGECVAANSADSTNSITDRNSDMPAERNILVVDDEELIRLLLDGFLTSAGYRVHKASCVLEALAMLREQDLQLVLSDMHMPGATGYDLLAQIQEEMPDVPVIIMTGKPSIEAAVECIKIGAVDYLAKPIDLEKLGSLIAKAFRRQKESEMEQTVVIGGTTDLHRHAMGGYRVIATIGRGNMGVVLLAEKEVDGKRQKFALKIMKPSFFNDDDDERQKWLRRFCREAECAARITHPGVVRVIEYDILGGDQVPYLVMEYCDGTQLDRWERKETASPPTLFDKVKVIRQVADALGAIHAQDICHRDIKPPNILVDTNLNVKLTDFGVARPVDMTASTDVVGTPLYMAPEAFSRGNPDPRSDLFALGVVAYELFLGERPFAADTIPGVILAITHGQPVAPLDIEPAFPKSLQDILARMLKKDPSKRYQSATEAVVDLDAFLADRKLPIGHPKRFLAASDWKS